MRIESCRSDTIGGRGSTPHSENSVALARAGGMRVGQSDFYREWQLEWGSWFFVRCLLCVKVES